MNQLLSIYSQMYWLVTRSGVQMLELLIFILIDRWGTCLMVQLVVSIGSSSGGGFGHSYTFYTILCVCCTKQVQVVICFYRLGNDYNGNWFPVVVDVRKLGYLSTNLDISQALICCRWLVMTYVDLAVHQHPFLCQEPSIHLLHFVLPIRLCLWRLIIFLFWLWPGLVIWL